MLITDIKILQTDIKIQGFYDLKYVINHEIPKYNCFNIFKVMYIPQAKTFENILVALDKMF